MNSTQIPEFLAEPLDAIVFDCDGTLSRIEGIDELAKISGVGEQVTEMTALAMAKTGLSCELYEERLQLVQPTESQVRQLAHTYFKFKSEDVIPVIDLFQKLHKSVYIISAGVNPAVTLFGEMLGVPVEQIYAVNLSFNAAKHYAGFDQESPLIRPRGKRHIVTQILQQHKRLLYTGDGLNDLDVIDLVTRFVGYGGAYYRANIEERCEFYLRHETLSALLPLALSELEYQQLSVTEQQLYLKGLDSLDFKENLTIT